MLRAASSLLCVRGIVMADERFIWFEVDEDETILGFKLQEEKFSRRQKDFLDDLSDHGIQLMKMYAPEGDSGYLHDHIDKSVATWEAGGAGGGGNYEQIVGVKAGTSQHPIYVEIGTGLYGRFKSPVISPVGNRMWFYAEGLGRRIGRYKLRGQEPQRYVYQTWRDLALYAHARLLAAKATGTGF